MWKIKTIINDLQNPEQDVFLASFNPRHFLPVGKKKSNQQDGRHINFKGSTMKYDAQNNVTFDRCNKQCKNKTADSEWQSENF